MSKTFANTYIANNTFYMWLDKTNEMRAAFGNTVTTAPNTAGDMTIGNGFVTGILGANTLTATYIKGGNVQSNAIVTFVSNVSIGNSTLSILQTQADTVVQKAASYTTTNTSAQILDSFATTAYRGGKYLVSMKEVDALTYQTTELMILHDGTNGYITEYATLQSASTLGTFSCNIDSGNFRLYVTPSTQNNVIKYYRTVLVV